MMPASKMKIVKEMLAFLSSGEFFSGVIERMFALLVSVALFAALILCYVYKPVILLYILIAGLLIMGWFMLYFIFPEIHERIAGLKRFIRSLPAKFRSK